MEIQEIIYGKDDVKCHDQLIFKKADGTYYQDIQEIISSRIKLLREQHNISQQKLAEMLHITQKAYWRMEQPDYSPRIDKIIALAYFYNICPSYFLGISNEQKPINNTYMFKINGFSLNAKNHKEMTKTQGTSAVVLEKETILIQKYRSAAPNIKRAVDAALCIDSENDTTNENLNVSEGLEQTIEAGLKSPKLTNIK